MSLPHNLFSGRGFFIPPRPQPPPNKRNDLNASLYARALEEKSKLGLLQEPHESLSKSAALNALRCYSPEPNATPPHSVKQSVLLSSASSVGRGDTRQDATPSHSSKSSIRLLVDEIDDEDQFLYGEDDIITKSKSFLPARDEVQRSEWSEDEDDFDTSPPAAVSQIKRVEKIFGEKKSASSRLAQAHERVESPRQPVKVVLDSNKSSVVKTENVQKKKSLEPTPPKKEETRKKLNTPSYFDKLSTIMGSTKNSSGPHVSGKSASSRISSKPVETFHRSQKQTASTSEEKRASPIRRHPTTSETEKSSSKLHNPKLQPFRITTTAKKMSSSENVLKAAEERLIKGKKSTDVDYDDVSSEEESRRSRYKSSKGLDDKTYLQSKKLTAMSSTKDLSPIEAARLAVKSVQDALSSAKKSQAPQSKKEDYNVSRKRNRSPSPGYYYPREKETYSRKSPKPDRSSERCYNYDRASPDRKRKTHYKESSRSPKRHYEEVSHNPKYRYRRDRSFSGSRASSSSSVRSRSPSSDYIERCSRLKNSEYSKRHTRYTSPPSRSTSSNERSDHHYRKRSKRSASSDFQAEERRDRGDSVEVKNATLESVALAASSKDYQGVEERASVGAANESGKSQHSEQSDELKEFFLKLEQSKLAKQQTAPFVFPVHSSGPAAESIQTPATLSYAASDQPVITQTSTAPQSSIPSLADPPMPMYSSPQVDPNLAYNMIPPPQYNPYGYTMDPQMGYHMGMHSYPYDPYSYYSSAYMPPDIHSDMSDPSHLKNKRSARLSNLKQIPVAETHPAVSVPSVAEPKLEVPKEVETYMTSHSSTLREIPLMHSEKTSVPPKKMTEVPPIKISLSHREEPVMKTPERSRFSSIKVTTAHPIEKISSSQHTRMTPHQVDSPLIHLNEIPSHHKENSALVYHTEKPLASHHKESAALSYPTEKPSASHRKESVALSLHTEKPSASHHQETPLTYSAEKPSISHRKDKSPASSHQSERSPASYHSERSPSSYHSDKSPVRNAGKALTPLQLSQQIEKFIKMRKSLCNKTTALLGEIKNIESLGKEHQRRSGRSNAGLKLDLEQKTDLLVKLMEKSDMISIKIKLLKEKSEKLPQVAIEDTPPSPEIIKEGPLEPKVTYSFFDGGNHWCQQCNEVLPTVLKKFEHLHSAKHKQLMDPLKRPWLKTIKPDDKLNLGGTIKCLPVSGCEFLMPVEGLYCVICCETFPDDLPAEKHLKDPVHFKNYQKYLDVNPDYERKYHIAMSAGTAIIESEKRKKEREDKKSKALSSNKGKNDQESKDTTEEMKASVKLMFSNKNPPVPAKALQKKEIQILPKKVEQRIVYIGKKPGYIAKSKKNEMGPLKNLKDEKDANMGTDGSQNSENDSSESKGIIFPKKKNEVSSNAKKSESPGNTVPSNSSKSTVDVKIKEEVKSDSIKASPSFGSKARRGLIGPIMKEYVKSESSRISSHSSKHVSGSSKTKKGLIGPKMEDQVNSEVKRASSKNSCFGCVASIQSPVATVPLPKFEPLQKTSTPPLGATLGVVSIADIELPKDGEAVFSVFKPPVMSEAAQTVVSNNSPSLEPQSKIKKVESSKSENGSIIEAEPMEICPIETGRIEIIAKPEIRTQELSITGKVSGMSSEMDKAGRISIGQNFPAIELSKPSVKQCGKLLLEEEEGDFALLGINKEDIMAPLAVPRPPPMALKQSSIPSNQALLATPPKLSSSEVQIPFPMSTLMKMSPEQFMKGNAPIPTMSNSSEVLIPVSTLIQISPAKLMNPKGLLPTPTTNTSVMPMVNKSGPNFTTLPAVQVPVPVSALVKMSPEQFMKGQAPLPTMSNPSEVLIPVSTLIQISPGELMKPKGFLPTPSVMSSERAMIPCDGNGSTPTPLNTSSELAKKDTLLSTPMASSPDIQISVPVSSSMQISLEIKDEELVPAPSEVPIPGSLSTPLITGSAEVAMSLDDGIGDQPSSDKSENSTLECKTETEADALVSEAGVTSISEMEGVTSSSSNSSTEICHNPSVNDRTSEMSPTVVKTTFDVEIALPLQGETGSIVESLTGNKISSNTLELTSIPSSEVALPCLYESGNVSASESTPGENTSFASAVSLFGQGEGNRMVSALSSLSDENISSSGSEVPSISEASASEDLNAPMKEAETIVPLNEEAIPFDVLECPANEPEIMEFAPSGENISANGCEVPSNPEAIVIEVLNAPMKEAETIVPLNEVAVSSGVLECPANESEIMQFSSLAKSITSDLPPVSNERTEIEVKPETITPIELLSEFPKNADVTNLVVSVVGEVRLFRKDDTVSTPLESHLRNPGASQATETLEPMIEPSVSSGEVMINRNFESKEMELSVPVKETDYLVSSLQSELNKLANLEKDSVIQVSDATQLETISETPLVSGTGISVSDIESMDTSDSKPEELQLPAVEQQMNDSKSSSLERHQYMHHQGSLKVTLSSILACDTTAIEAKYPLVQQQSEIVGEPFGSLIKTEPTPINTLSLISSDLESKSSIIGVIPDSSKRLRQSETIDGTPSMEASLDTVKNSQERVCEIETESRTEENLELPQPGEEFSAIPSIQSMLSEPIEPLASILCANEGSNPVSNANSDNSMPLLEVQSPREASSVSNFDTVSEFESHAAESVSFRKSDIVVSPVLDLKEDSCNTVILDLSSEMNEILPDLEIDPQLDSAVDKIFENE